MPGAVNAVARAKCRWAAANLLFGRLRARMEETVHFEHAVFSLFWPFSSITVQLSERLQPVPRNARVRNGGVCSDFKALLYSESLP
jgi:hypothetical protein